MFESIIVSCPFPRNLRSRYESAKEQLEKGRKMFENVMKPVADTPGGWHYTGFVAFPEIDNRTELNRYLNLGEEDLTVNLLRVNKLKFKFSFPSSCLQKLKLRTAITGGLMD